MAATAPLSNGGRVPGCQSFAQDGQNRGAHHGLLGLLGLRSRETTPYAPRTTTEQGSDPETSGSGETAGRGTFG